MSDVELACARLAVSRELLRQSMAARTPARLQPSQAGTHRPTAQWLNSLKSMPAASIVLETLGSWWAHHPLRLAGVVAAEALGAVARPMAQRNPLGLIIGAALLGGVFVWTRPWRWIIKPALFAGLAPQLIARLVSHLPPSSWMGVFESLTRPRRSNDRAPAQPSAQLR